MKKFTRIFFAVAALAVGFIGCTTDTTEDLGVQLGSGAGQTTLTLSLEESRTQLGKAVAGLYPVTWSAGDAISVNGVASSAIAISDNAAVATFTFNEALEYPYAIAYPAASAGKVVFADQQVHTVGTFANGAAAMYGYKTAESGLTLNHLTGVLKIGVTGDKTLSFAQISTVDRAPIAGQFGLDFATGELTATDASKELISYSFGDGLALSADAQYIHATVPAGQYDELYVTLYDTEGGVMYATVKADDSKPLAAGKVREFSNTIAYAPNAEAFVIRDVTSLKAFGEQAATLEKDALFVADVDMTGETWTPIEGYAKTVLGNGYSIKGLTAPLFGTTNASIKGLHLKDVNIEENSNLAVGALARHIEASIANTPVVEHCSVSGSVVMNNSTTPYAVVNTQIKTDTYSTIAVAGLVARTYGVTISDCVNHAKVEVKQCIPSTNTTQLYPAVGGVTGYIGTITIDGTALYSSVIDTNNYGDVNFIGSSYTGELTIAVHSKLAPYVAGVIATASSANKTASVIKNIKNYGDITISGKVGGTMAIGGTIGYMACLDASYIYNYGNVTIENGEFYAMYLGGVIAQGAKTNTASDAHNYGNVLTAETATIAYLICGGVFGYQPTGAFVPADTTVDFLRNSTNSGTITILHNDLPDAEHDGTTGFYYRIGGVVGWTQNYIYNCQNLESGKITCRGDLYQILESNYAVCVGGIAGYKTINLIHNCINYAPIDVDLNITTKEGFNIDKTRLNVGGIAGYIHVPCTDSTNNGDISVSGSLAGRLHLGGVCGHTNGVNANMPQSANLVNNGSVTIEEGTKIGGKLLIGGVAGYMSKNENCTNNGAVTISDNVSWGAEYSYLGGCAGYVAAKALAKNMTNNAPFTIGKNCTHIGSEYDYIGGVIGQLQGDADGLYNTANGVITIGKSDYTGYVLLGGCLGTAPAWSDNNKEQVNFKIENCENRAAINYYGVSTSNLGLYVGGVFGYIYEQTLGGVLIAAETNHIDNYGPIKIESDNQNVIKMGGIAAYMGGTSSFVHNHESGTINLNVNTRSHVHIGGISQALKDVASDLTNDGNVTVNGTVGGTLYIGGCIKDNHNYKRIRCVNNGDITVNAQMSTGCFVGGICYDGGSKMYFDYCHNTGDFIFGENASGVRYLAWGGIVGKVETTSTANYNVLTGCSNSGDIIIKGNPASAGYCAMGGAYGFIYGASKIIVAEGFTNSGDIIFEGNHTGAYTGPTDHKTRNSVDIGGFAGWVAADNTWASSSYTSWTGNIVNTGDIKHTGSVKSNVHMGGFFGHLNNVSPVVTEGAFINTGDIICTGTYDATAVPSGVGGFAGVATKEITGAQSYCNVLAPGHPAAGMITGSSRSATVIAKNCKVGGSFIQTEIGEDSDGNNTTIYTEIKIDESNWMNYIYGGTTSWPEGSDYDGCSFLSVVPEV